MREQQKPNLKFVKARGTVASRSGLPHSVSMMRVIDLILQIYIMFLLLLSPPSSTSNYTKPATEFELQH